MRTLPRSMRHSKAGKGVFLSLLTLLVVAFPDPASAQSVSEILSRAMDQNEARLGGIENLRIQQEVMGISTTTYMVKETVDGHSTLRPHSVEVSGAGGMTQQLSTENFLGDSRRMYSDWADRWSLEGRGSVQGEATWTLVLDRFDGIDFEEFLPQQEGQQITPSEMTMELEVERLIPLFIKMDGTVQEGGETRPVSVEISLSDYQEVSGYLHPMLNTIEMDIANAGVSPEQVAEAREGFEELQRQLEQMPAAQRQMMEQVMGGQLASMQEMFAGDRIRMEMRVTDIQANVTLP